MPPMDQWQFQLFDRTPMLLNIIQSMCIPLQVMSNHLWGTTYACVQAWHAGTVCEKPPLCGCINSQGAIPRTAAETTSYIVNSTPLASARVHTDPRAKPASISFLSFPSLPTPAENINSYTPLLLLFIVFVQSSAWTGADTYLPATLVSSATSIPSYY